MRNRVAFFSLILNVILLGLFVFKSTPGTKKNVSNISVLNKKNIQKEIENYLNQGFLELVLELKNEAHIEGGIKHQDLALSVLVSNYDFDIKRIFKGSEISHLEYLNSKTQETEKLKFIKNVDQETFKILFQFGLKEKYPMTSQGLFMRIKNGDLDKHLIEAFFLTKEFEWFFSVMEFSNRIECLKMLLEVDFSLIHTLYETYCTQPAEDLLIQIGVSLSFDGHSMRAANHLLEMHFDFITKRFSDEQLLKLMTLFSKKTTKLVSFSTSILHSNRSHKVKTCAAILLFRYFDLELPIPFDLEKALYQLQKLTPQIDLHLSNQNIVFDLANHSMVSCDLQTSFWLENLESNS